MVTFIRRPQICTICGLLYIITKKAYFTEGVKKQGKDIKVSVLPLQILKNIAFSTHFYGFWTKS